MRSCLKIGFLVVCCCIWIGCACAAGAVEPVAPAAPEPSSTVPAPAQATDGKSPSIEVPETAYDFGEAYEGEAIKHEFVVKNTGQGELEITQVRVGCSCTVVHFDRTIPPGGEGKVAVQVNLGNMEGKIQKTADVFSNDPVKSRVTLQISGEVRSFIEVLPSAMVFFQGMADQLKEETIELRSSPQTFHVKSVESNIDDKIGYKLETVEDGKRYQLKVSNKVSMGDYHGFIKVVTDHPKKPEVLIRVNASVTGEISVRPMSLLVGSLDAGSRAPRKGVVAVVNNRDKPFEITKLTYDEQILTVTQKPISGKQGYSLEIEPKLEGLEKGSQRQIPIVIETDATPNEKFTIQVHVLNK